MAEKLGESDIDHMNGQDGADSNGIVKHSREWYKQRLGDPKLNQILTLKSGKHISVGEAGDLNGSPVFVFPGLGGSRQMLVLLEKQAKVNGLRLISPDRPGVGLSDDADSSEGKQPLAWANIVAEVADQLKIEQFALIGHSCGAIFALACSIKFPERIIGDIQLVSPWIPLSSPGTKSSLRMAQYAPGFLVGASSNIMASFPSMMSSMGSINLMTKGYSQGETKGFDKNFFEEFFSIASKENKSGFKNAVMVCMEKYGPWEFKFEDASLSCHIYHGGKDTMVPLDAAKWASKAIPTCKLTVFDDATHNAIMDLDIMATVFKTVAKV